MRRVISDQQFWRLLAGFERSAWRFEQQPSYAVGYEQDQFDLFLAGAPEPPTENRELGAWMAQVKQQTGSGRTVGRVRIVDDPITDYQRWMQWMDRWNREAGETIDYLPRARARQAGIVPAAGDSDWWLFDDTVLMLMHFNTDGERTHVELVVEELEVFGARSVRDAAIAAARESGGSPTTQA